MTKVGFSDQNFPTIIQISSELLKMVAGKLRRLVPSNTLVRKRSESGGKQATHLALAAGWHWVAWWQPGVACWQPGVACWQPGMACWWPLSEAEPPVPVPAGLCYCCCFKPCFFLTILETAMRPVVAGCSFNQY